MPDTDTRQYVLRKTVGGNSPGTRVQVVAEDHTNTVDPEMVNSVLAWLPGAREAVDIPRSLLVKLRNKSDVVPAVPRINRPDRLAKRQLWLMFNG